MFTGIVEGVANVVGIEDRSAGRRLTLSGLPEDLGVGGSVAVNGCCLTVAERTPEHCAFDLAGETLRRTNLSELRPGDRVNFERSLRIGDRLDGHFVQGHVDGTGVIRRLEPQGADWWLEVAAPEPLLRQMIGQGSICVDGISLTIASLEAASFRCTIIPHTREVTNLRWRSAGERVNLETDVLGKWVARRMESS